MKRTLLILSLLALPAVANAQSAPMAVQNGPDLQFVCASSSGDARSCQPVHAHYKRYMHLANWRFVGAASAPGSCVLNHTYGYGKDAVWVAGGCVGVFRAPDLRYGDGYNRQRLMDAYDVGVVAVPAPFIGPAW